MNWLIFIDPSFAARLCLTLLHSLWQVPLLYLFVSLVNRLWRRRSIENAHALHVAGLLACLAAVAFTFVTIDEFLPYSYFGTYAETLPLLTWSSWSVPLFVTDFALSGCSMIVESFRPQRSSASRFSAS